MHITHFNSGCLFAFPRLNSAWLDSKLSGLRITRVAHGVFLAGVRCSYTSLTSAASASVAWREKMALITGCNTGKHPAAPLPGHEAARTACGRGRRRRSPAHATAPASHSGCKIIYIYTYIRKPVSLRRCVIYMRGIPAVRYESPGKATPSDCPDWYLRTEAL